MTSEYTEIFILSTLLLGFTQALNVETSIGTIQSKFDKFGDRGVHKFMGIPYAEAPIGDLRFQEPIPTKQLISPHISVQGSVCPQDREQLKFFDFTDDSDANFHMSEDCLYMNIYVPSDSEGNVPENLPVMFYIHSGAWSWGSGNHYDGRWLPLNGNVILVTFNYRLNIFGFLRTDDRQIINNGLKDQILAFNFVHENIKNFGGDPNSITVFGHSAGGATTGYFHAIPELRGKIRRIIPMAGLPTSSWARFRPLERQNFTDHIAKASSCIQNYDYVDCLRSKTVDELVEISIKVTVSMNMLSAWMPSPDSKHVSSDSDQYDSDFVLSGLEKVDVLANMAFSEGISILAYLTTLRGVEIGDHIDVKDLVSMIDMANIGLLGKLKTIFKGEKQIPIRKAIDFVTEYSMWYPLYDFARVHNQFAEPGKSTYMLVYNYANEDKRGVFPRPEWLDNAVHGDELPLVFGTHLSAIRPGTEKDREIGKIYLTYLTNFVKTGDPNKPEPVPVPWQQFTDKTRQHLYFDKTAFTTRKLEFLVKSPEYWDEVHYANERGADLHDEL